MSASSTSSSKYLYASIDDTTDFSDPAAVAALRGRAESFDIIKKTTKKLSGVNVGHTYDGNNKKLGLWAFMVLAFYSVNGGAFGIEDIVRAGGPFYALCGFSLLLVWALPEALITAELSTAFPDSSGSVMWVQAAFGDFWAFQKGWLSWLSGVSDNALYPILFLDCLLAFLKPVNNQDDDSVGGSEALSNWLDEYRWTVILAITIILTLLNYRGLDVVGNVVMVICFFALFPFAIFVCVGAFKVQPSRWLITPPGGYQGVQWRLLLNTFFWNINFWESASCFSADVDEPEKVYPRGMMMAVLLVFVSSFLPVLIGTGASPDSYTEWHDGYFTHLAIEIVGPWLGYLFMFGAAVTNIGMFEAEMSSDAWQVAGMADNGALPKVLGVRNRFGVPLYGVLLSAMGIALLGCLSFSSVIDMLNLLYCLGQVIEFAAFLHLRRTKPQLIRPYKIPMGLVGCSIMLSFPLAFIGIIIYCSSAAALIFTAACAVAGVAVFYLLGVAKARNWCEFATGDNDGEGGITNNTGERELAMTEFYQQQLEEEKS